MNLVARHNGEENMNERKKISFIGSGNMGEALIRGLQSSEIFSGEEIMAADRDERRRREISQGLLVKVTEDNRRAARFGDIVVLAIKPQHLSPVLREIGPELKPQQLLVSILAGVPTSRLEKTVGKKIPVIRVMPNTPVLIKAGVAAVSPGKYAGEEHLALAERILSSVARVVRLDEEMMDAVTAISGSGPAYLYYFTEALAAAGRELGFEAELAETLAVRTVVGSAKLLEGSGDPADILRRRVTSPGGTTEAALKVLEESGFAGMLKEAVRKAWERSRELGRESRG